MTIQTIVEPYELLIRWRDGQISGVHKQEIITVKDGETVLSVSEGKAQVLDLADVPSFIPAQDTLANISRLLSEAAQKDREIAALILERDDLASALAAARKQIEHLSG